VSFDESTAARVDPPHRRVRARAPRIWRPRILTNTFDCQRWESDAQCMAPAVGNEVLEMCVLTW